MENIATKQKQEQSVGKQIIHHLYEELTNNFKTSIQTQLAESIKKFKTDYDEILKNKIESKTEELKKEKEEQEQKQKSQQQKSQDQEQKNQNGGMGGIFSFFKPKKSVFSLIKPIQNATMTSIQSSIGCSINTLQEKIKILLVDKTKEVFNTKEVKEMIKELLSGITFMELTDDSPVTIQVDTTSAFNHGKEMTPAIYGINQITNTVLSPQMSLIRMIEYIHHEFKESIKTNVENTLKESIKTNVETKQTGISNEQQIGNPFSDTQLEFITLFIAQTMGCSIKELSRILKELIDTLVMETFVELKIDELVKQIIDKNIDRAIESQEIDKSAETKLANEPKTGGNKSKKLRNPKKSRIPKKSRKSKKFKKSNLC